MLSSGNFILTASVTNIVNILETDSNSFNIINYVKSISATVDNVSPSINFDVLVEAYFIGDDDLDFLAPLTVTLMEASNKIVHGDVSVDIENINESSHNIWFPSFGTYSLRVTTSSSNAYFDLLIVNVQKNILKITEPNPLPETNVDFFTILIKIYDATGQFIETERGSYQVTLYYENDSNIFTQLITTSGGAYELSKVLIDVGNYTVSASCSLTTVSNSFNLSLIEGIAEADISSNYFTQPVNKIFKFDALLLNWQSEIILNEYPITISCENEGLIQTQISHNGSVNFFLYITKVGLTPCELKTNSNKTLQEIEFDVVNSTTPDLECKIALNSTACYECAKNSTMNNNLKCDCVKHSSYNDDEEMYICDPGLNYSIGYCYKHGNYFSSSEIFAYYSQDYTKIFVEFFRQVNQTNIDCKSIYTIINSKTLIEKNCYWSNPTTMIIQFAKIVYSDNLYIDLNPTLVQAVGKNDYKTLSPLNIKIETKFPLLFPEAILVAPEVVALPCLIKDVIIFTRTLSYDYLYFWKATFVSEYDVNLDSLNKYINSQDNYYVIFSKEFFEEKGYTNGVLNLTLEVKSKLFKTKAFAWRSFKIQNEIIVMVAFTAGNSIIMKANQELQLKIQVLENCFNEKTAYQIEKPLNFSIISLNSSKILDKATIKRSDYVYFPPNTFKPYNSYKFLATAKGENKSGNSTIIVKIEPSDIEINLTRSSGSFSKSNDLLIKAYARDPDDIATYVKYYWNCSEGPLPCIDSKNAILSYKPYLSQLFISKELLRNGAIYLFNLSVFIKEKTRSVQTEITIDAATRGEIIMKPFTSAINNDRALLIAPNITKNIKNAEYNWRFSPPLPNETDIITDYSYINIKPNSLNPGIPTNLNSA